MRNGQNKRMRGRNRNKGHHGHHHNPLTRVYESNGPEVKIRGTAHHIAEKYLQLARDATASGDHVMAENYYQHAEHYFRLIAAAQEQLRQQNPYYQPQQIAPGPDGGDASFDGDEDVQPLQGQQPGFGHQLNSGQQPSYQPRESAQPYGGPQPVNRPQPQPQSYQQQPYQQQPQPNYDSNEGLPSFITGAQPTQPAPAARQSLPNGYDNQGGERYPRHRRRRHRGGGPRPDMQGGQDFRGDDGPDDSRPDNG